VLDELRQAREPDEVRQANRPGVELRGTPDHESVMAGREQLVF
jgi:hypothetical protein